ncbi:MAG: Fis family transcriptional regulator [Verrucomicrobiaceae bacterium]|nr:Fis family transcriptional regulator [Verrucomicrobiaceae bacterium]
MAELLEAKFDSRHFVPAFKNVSRDVVEFDNPPAYSRSIRATALVFEDPASRALYERLEKLAPSNANVLIIGETGTGKELVARQVHRLSGRGKGPFIAVNCAALPEQLVESELFGHEKGAFTGAQEQKKGWFEVANGGTLFLDEIGDLPPATQVKLLRVLQERVLSRVGSRTTIPINIRLVAATNVNLEEAVKTGRFREDLYYRLNVAKVNLPPLRERLGDIGPLAEHFVETYRENLGIAAAGISESAREALLDYPWPGNIRELENVIHHAMLVMQNNIIEAEDLDLAKYSFSRSSPDQLQQEVNDRQANLSLEHALLDLLDGHGKHLFADIEARVVRCAFEYCQHNQLQTAKLLGISRNILRHRLKLYGMLQ